MSSATITACPLAPITSWLVERVADHLDVTPHTARRVIRTVSTALRADLPPDEIEKVAKQLPPDIQSLWLPAPG